MGILGLPGLDYIFRRGWLHFFFMLFLARTLFAGIESLVRLNFDIDFWICIFVFTFWWAREQIIWKVSSKKSTKLAGLISGTIIILLELVALFGTISGNLSYSWLPGYLLFDWFFFKYIQFLLRKERSN